MEYSALFLLALSLLKPRGTKVSRYSDFHLKNSLLISLLYYMVLFIFFLGYEDIKKAATLYKFHKTAVHFFVNLAYKLSIARRPKNISS